MISCSNLYKKCVPRPGWPCTLGSAQDYLERCRVQGARLPRPEGKWPVGYPHPWTCLRRDEPSNQKHAQYQEGRPSDTMHGKQRKRHTRQGLEAPWRARALRTKARQHIAEAPNATPTGVTGNQCKRHTRQGLEAPWRAQTLLAKDRQHITEAPNGQETWEPVQETGNDSRGKRVKGSKHLGTRQRLDACLHVSGLEPPASSMNDGNQCASRAPNTLAHNTFSSDGPRSFCTTLAGAYCRSSVKY